MLTALLQYRNLFTQIVVQNIKGNLMCKTIIYLRYIVYRVPYSTLDS